MRAPIRLAVSATFFTTAILLSAPAFAEAGAPEGGAISLSSNATLASEYRFRGVDYSGGDFVLQSGVDVGLPFGLYAGVWGSAIDSKSVGFGGNELDIYAGITKDLGLGLKLDVGAVRYMYPDAPGTIKADYHEAYAKLGFSFGPAEAKVAAFYAPKQDSLDGMSSKYASADVSVGVPLTPFTAAAHVGYSDGFLSFTEDKKALDWSVGLNTSVPLTPLTVGVAYVGAEGGPYKPDDYNFTKSGVVVTLSASF